MMLLVLSLFFALNTANVLVPCPSGELCLTFGFTYGGTGTQSTEGNALMRGYVLWANKTNAAGGILAKDQNHYKVGLYAYDDQSNTSLVTQYYETLIKTDQVNYTLGPYGSSYTAAAINKTQDLNKLLVFSQAADDSIFNNITTLTSWTFGLMTAGSDYMHTILQTLAAHDAKTIVVLRSTSGFTTSVWNGMLEIIKNLPTLVILANVTYAPGGNASDAKFKPLVEQLQKAVPNPDIFISLSFLAEGPYITAAIRELNYQPNSIAMTSGTTEGNSLYVYSPDQWNVNIPNMSDAFYGTSFDFNKSYFAAYPNSNETAVTQYTAGGAASGYVFATAIARSISLDQADVRDALQKLNGGDDKTPFQTFYGNVTFTSLGQNSAKEMVVTQVLVNEQNKFEAKLVGPAPYNVIGSLYPIPYGCNDTKACNSKIGTINNNSCVYPPKVNDLKSCPANNAASHSIPFSGMFITLLLSFYTFLSH